MSRRWEAHIGEDYAVVMAPGEHTGNASIRVFSDNIMFPQRLADLLNADARPRRFRALVLLAALWIAFTLGYAVGGLL